MWGGGTGQACTWLKTLKSLTRTVTIHQLRLRCGRWTGQWTPIYITFTTYITYTTFLGPSHNVTHARTLLIKRNYSHISLSFLLFGGKHNTTHRLTLFQESCLKTLNKLLLFFLLLRRLSQLLPPHLSRIRLRPTQLLLRRHQLLHHHLSIPVEVHYSLSLLSLGFFNFSIYHNISLAILRFPLVLFQPMELIWILVIFLLGFNFGFFVGFSPFLCRMWHSQILTHELVFTLLFGLAYFLSLLFSLPRN